MYKAINHTIISFIILYVSRDHARSKSEYHAHSLHNICHNYIYFLYIYMYYYVSYTRYNIHVCNRMQACTHVWMYICTHAACMSMRQTTWWVGVLLSLLRRSPWGFCIYALIIYPCIILYQLTRSSNEQIQEPMDWFYCWLPGIRSS